MVLTNSEAKIVRALGDAGANTYELASSTELTTTEVRQLSSNLLQRHLVKTEDDGQYVRLTDEGQLVRRSLGQPSSPRFKLGQQLSSARRVLVVPDREGHAISRSELNDAELDTALDTAVRNLSN
jgi:hypothetical protein